MIFYYDFLYFFDEPDKEISSKAKAIDNHDNEVG